MNRIKRFLSKIWFLTRKKDRLRIKLNKLTKQIQEHAQAGNINAVAQARYKLKSTKAKLKAISA